MGQKRRKYEEQYKREAVRFLEETGRSLREVAQELRISPTLLWRWRAKYGSGEGATPLTASEADELRRLRREVNVLREERDFLKKAAAYFANRRP